MPLLTSAQERLTLQDALGIALKNNYNILIAKNTAEIARNDNTAGNAGMLPSVEADASANKTVNDLNQEYTDGRTVDKNGVNITTSTAGVTLNWTLFDGLAMFATKNKLEELAAQGEINFKIQLETTVQNVITAYFDVAQRQILIDAIAINIAIDSERVALAQARLDAGSGARLELLQAKVDLNEQLSARMKLVASWENGKDNLNYLLSRKPGTAFIVADSIVITYKSNPEQLRSSVLQNNFMVQSSARERNISLYSLKEMKALRYPSIDFSTGYNYLNNKSAAGFLLVNQNTGYTYGLGLRWNLFDGGNVSRQIKNARLNLASSGFYEEDTKLQISTQLEKAMRDFDNNMQMLALEQDNILLARENLDVAFERFPQRLIQFPSTQGCAIQFF
jgi:outer membrane protein TolC